MGQYLSIGLLTQIAVNKEEAIKGKISFEILCQKLQKDSGLLLENYEQSEEDNYWVWNLKKELLTDSLIPFLEQFYNAYYIDDKSDTEDVLESLRATNSVDEWLKRAEDKAFYAFQEDNYGHSKYLHFNEVAFRPTVKWEFDAIMLASAGKIMMDAYGYMFKFLSHTIQHRFANSPLSGALQIYITG